ncbi:hypothetical protein IGI04_016750 [Brassica rapa subsp. trilocularis]|uniref:Protein kinase domain-containing protein n=1 Tax=Brassica rapa subsp. trilocularis TaxID=1813537 RepID=A0ABQ7MTV4_BRACM|nr:hypothetical protein IGI04_016750 [Brassica rapa subsp. trilocularis]
MSQSGRVVGDYLVGRHMNIGTGSFSVLWEAKHSLFTGLMWLSRRYLWPGLTRSFRTVSCLRFLSSEDQSSQLHPFARRGRGYTSKSGPLYGTRTKTRSLQPMRLAETLCVSPLYMAPEIMKLRKYDASCHFSLRQLVASMHGANPDSHLNLTSLSFVITIRFIIAITHA